jgi:hypothetical protein
VIKAQLAGGAPGRLTIMAMPTWDGATGGLRLTDLGFVFDAEHPDQGLAADLFYERIRSALDQAANDLLQARTGQIRDGLQAALARTLGPALPAGAGIDLSGVKLRDLAIEVGDARLRLTGSAGGNLKVALGASPGG